MAAAESVSEDPRASSALMSSMEGSIAAYTPAPSRGRQSSLKNEMEEEAPPASTPPPYSPGPSGSSKPAEPNPEERRKSPENFIQAVPFEPAPAPAAADTSKKEASSNSNFVVTDFWPTLVQRGIAEQQKLPVFQPFSSVMQCANGFLQQNPHLRVFHLETLKTSTDFKGRMAPEKNVDLDPAMGWKITVQGLRLWCIPEAQPLQQQLWFLDMMPRGMEAFGKLDAFEGMEITLNRLNEFLAQHPIPGAVISINTLNLLRLASLLTFAVDLNCSCQGAPANAKLCLMTFFRVFYLCGPPCYERVGVKKFVPKHTVRGAKVRWAELSELIIEASAWSLTQPIRVTNIQTVKSPAMPRNKGNAGMLPTHVATNDMSMTISADSSMVFCLMVGFTFRTDGFRPPPSFPSGTLNSRTFFPWKIGEKTYESVQATLSRICAYLQRTGSRIVFAETVAIPHNPQFDVIHEEKVQYDMAMEKSQYYVTAYRLYFDGISAEIPEDLHPRSPKAVQSGVCSIL